MISPVDLFLDRGREMRDVRRSSRLALYRVVRSQAAQDRHARAWLAMRSPCVMFGFGVE